LTHTYIADLTGCYSGGENLAIQASRVTVQKVTTGRQPASRKLTLTDIVCVRESSPEGTSIGKDPNGLVIILPLENLEGIEILGDPIHIDNFTVDTAPGRQLHINAGAGCPIGDRDGGGTGQDIGVVVPFSGVGDNLVVKITYQNLILPITQAAKGIKPARRNGTCKIAIEKLACRWITLIESYIWPTKSIRDNRTIKSGDFTTDTPAGGNQGGVDIRSGLADRGRDHRTLGEVKRWERELGGGDVIVQLRVKPKGAKAYLVVPAAKSRESINTIVIGEANKGDAIITCGSVK
jgi:hypothetical protein